MKGKTTIHPQYSYSGRKKYSADRNWTNEFNTNFTSLEWDDKIRLAQEFAPKVTIRDVSGLPVWERAKLQQTVEKQIGKKLTKRRAAFLTTFSSLLEKNCFRCREQPWKHMVSAIKSLLCDHCYRKYDLEVMTTWRENNPGYWTEWVNRPGNRQHYNDYMAEYMRKYRARKRAA